MEPQVRQVESSGGDVGNRQPRKDPGALRLGVLIVDAAGHLRYCNGEAELLVARLADSLDLERLAKIFVPLASS